MHSWPVIANFTWRLGTHGRWCWRCHCSDRWSWRTHTRGWLWRVNAWRRLRWSHGHGHEGAANVTPAPLLSSMQFFFYKYSKLEQMVSSSKFLIINNVLNFKLQSTIEVTNFILWILYYPTTYHAFLECCIVIENKHISLVQALQFLTQTTFVRKRNKVITHCFV